MRNAHADAATPVRLRHRTGLLLLALLPFGAAAGQDPRALPEDGRVVAGNATLSASGHTLTVAQRSNRAILEWRSFNIGHDATVQFEQPSASAIALNRVVGGDASHIAGQLLGNGHVYLVNAAGVLFGRDARIDVGHLVTSTLDIGNHDFLAGRNGSASTAGAALSATDRPASAPAQDPRSEPPFRLPAPAGTASATADAAGEEPQPAPSRLLTMDAGADGHLRLGVQPTEVQALLDSGSLREDEDGLVLTSSGVNALRAAVVAHEGAPQARVAAVREGRLLLLADGASEARSGEDAGQGIVD
ncbi:filamentous hemagglutinin N-terminal domain-containing protein [Pseudoxanthomonas suwonensis]|uniref:two-partner secretion domain-containing protein n=1 Tax=Pseudoxanthomonas suwonensis TaxID=314722 RepID=UPI000AA35916|nr:filamentous hemagglutinin N-terminal domain-containing protein [Pseudoxanthomonas suwonensis]